jgi:hypothetical protein
MNLFDSMNLAKYTLLLVSAIATLDFLFRIRV